MNIRLHIAVFILAAGEASRMGKIKQLLPWKDTFLLNHIIKIVAGAKRVKAFVVLGAHSEQIRMKLDRSDIEIIENPGWKKGIGTSISEAARYVRSNALEYDGMMFLLADQPLVTSEHLEKIVSEYEMNNNLIVASRYPDGKPGVPALFGQNYFSELENLDDDKGAKHILERHKDMVKAIDAKNLISDIDTIEDYNELTNRQ